MKIILQRVKSGSLTVNGKKTGSIGQGLVALIGFKPEDSQAEADYMVNKAVNLRIFEDENGNMNLALLDIGGELMVVPNFTLYANCKKGRRPSFVDAAQPEAALPLYDYTVKQFCAEAHREILCGEFGADMQVEICNDGPVTIDLDSDEIMPKGREQ